MDYLIGSIFGAVAIFTLAVFAIRDLNKTHKKEINHLQKYIDKWRKND